MPLSTRLIDEEVSQIFHAVLGKNDLPPHLPFRVVRVSEDGLPLKPPSHAYENGLYLLMAPAKRNRKTNVVEYPPVPECVQHLVVELDVIPDIQWGLSGPQFPLPTAIQQRYSYPTGPEEYCKDKGSSLWTIFETQGTEFKDLRLLHVYYSLKRAKKTTVAKKTQTTKKSIKASKPRGRKPNCARGNSNNNPIACVSSDVFNKSSASEQRKAGLKKPPPAPPVAAPAALPTAAAPSNPTYQSRYASIPSNPRYSPAARASGSYSSHYQYHYGRRTGIPPMVSPPLSGARQQIARRPFSPDAPARTYHSNSGRFLPRYPPRHMQHRPYPQPHYPYRGYSRQELSQDPRELIDRKLASRPANVPTNKCGGEPFGDFHDVEQVNGTAMDFESQDTDTVGSDTNEIDVDLSPAVPCAVESLDGDLSIALSFLMDDSTCTNPESDMPSEALADTSLDPLPICDADTFWSKTLLPEDDFFNNNLSQAETTLVGPIPLDNGTTNGDSDKVVVVDQIGDVGGTNNNDNVSNGNRSPIQDQEDDNSFSTNCNLEIDDTSATLEALILNDEAPLEALGLHEFYYGVASSANEWQVARPNGSQGTEAESAIEGVGMENNNNNAEQPLVQVDDVAGNPVAVDFETIREQVTNQFSISSSDEPQQSMRNFVALWLSDLDGNDSDEALVAHEQNDDDDELASVSGMMEGLD